MPNQLAFNTSTEKHTATLIETFLVTVLEKSDSCVFRRFDAFVHWRCVSSGTIPEGAVHRIPSGERRYCVRVTAASCGIVMRLLHRSPEGHGKKYRGCVLGRK